MPPRRKLTEAELEFLDRYLTKDDIVGVRFGGTTVDVQVVSSRCRKLDLPDTFGGKPVVVRDFPETADPAANEPTWAGDGSHGPLADILKRFP